MPQKANLEVVAAAAEFYFLGNYGMAIFESILGVGAGAVDPVSAIAGARGAGLSFGPLLFDLAESPARQNPCPVRRRRPNTYGERISVGFEAMAHVFRGQMVSGFDRGLWDANSPTISGA